MPVTTRASTQAGRIVPDSATEVYLLTRPASAKAKQVATTKLELQLEDFHRLDSGGGIGYQLFTEDDENACSSPAIWHKFVAVDADDSIYYGQVRDSGAGGRVRDVVRKLGNKTASQLFPVHGPSSNVILAADNLHPSSIFIKRLDLHMAMDKECRDISHEQFFREIDVMERLARAPHPNIVRYLGCRVRRGRVTGIVLERLSSCLGLRSGLSALSQTDKGVFVACLESAVEHLHGLGLAHNDINPNNIMIKEDGMPVLIDFGTCCHFRAFTGGQGTPGWTRGDTLAEISDPTNDNYALELLRKRLDNPLRLLMYKNVSG